MITQLLAENVKKLSAVQIDADGKPIVLTGDNEAGKTTVLDCIWMALTGKLPSMPIRAGETSGKIKLTIRIDDEDREITVERSFTGKGSYITVKDETQKKIASPQKLLDSLISSLTLDPHAFSRMKPKAQRETLLRIAGLDLTDWEKDYKEAYDARTIANRDAKQATAYFDGLDEAPKDTPDQEQSASELIDEIEAMQAKANQKNEEIRTRGLLGEAVEETKAEIKRLKESLANQEQHLKHRQEVFDKHVIPDAPTAEAIQAKRDALAKIEQTNTHVRTKQAQKAALATAQEKNVEADKADKKVKAILEQKEQMLEQADFGIPDLFVNDDGVLFEGKPLEQQSAARTIASSTRIAMRDESKLKLLIIRDASLIGSKIFKRIAEMADERGFQLWDERFQEEPGNSGIHITDGTVTHIAGQPVKSPTPPAEEVETVEGL